jgi:protein tyrosine phosphatase (PTP) superfamily phosphohydrolase (DUF442 family)
MAAALDAIAGVPNACLLAPTILTGGQPAPRNLTALGAAGRGIVLDLRDPMEPRPFDEAHTTRDAGLEYVNVPVTPTTQNDATIEKILGVLRGAAGRTVFVHCGSGNRVGGALIPWLILDQGFEEEDAVNQAMRVGLRSAELMEWGLDYARRNRPPTQP